MSTLPPATPPTPPVGALPWEERERRGLLESLFDTIGLLVSRPVEAWARTRESGDLASPLLFGTIVAWFSFTVHSVIARIITLPVLFPGALGRRFGTLGGYGYGHSGVGFFLRVVFSSLFIAIALFIGAAILHLCCMIVGALAGSQSGFEGSFRVVAYSEVTSLAAIIPVVGGIIALVWWIVLAVMGVQRLHRTTQSKAAAAVLIPIIVCCGGVIFLALIVGAAIFSRFGH